MIWLILNYVIVYKCLVFKFYDKFMEVFFIVSINELIICYEKIIWREYIEFINSKFFLYVFI